MIFDHLENAKKYEMMAARMPLAFQFLRQTDLNTLDLGLHSIADDEVFAIVSEQHTKPPSEVQWEAHRRFFDVQYVIVGDERIGHADINALTIVREYDEANDYLLLAGPGKDLIVTAGMFAIFGPQDAHRPNMFVDRPVSVRKVVVKVPVDR